MMVDLDSESVSGTLFQVRRGGRLRNCLNRAKSNKERKRGGDQTGLKKIDPQATRLYRDRKRLLDHYYEAKMLLMGN
jgi:hypothetical protein